MHITDEAISKIQRPERYAQEHYTDTQMQGFGVRVGHTARSFFVERRVNGRTVRQTIGRVGLIGADEARSIAKLKFATLGVPRALADIPGLQDLQIEVGSGIYFLCSGNSVVYVGQSIAALRRCSQHAESKKFDRILFLPCRPDDLDRTEAEFIHKLAPPLNGRSKLGKLISPRAREKRESDHFAG